MYSYWIKIGLYDVRIFLKFIRGTYLLTWFKVSFTARGLVPPVFTPLNEDLTVNYDVIPEYAQYLAKAGIKSVLGKSPFTDLPTDKLTLVPTPVHFTYKYLPLSFMLRATLQKKRIVSMV